MIFKEKMLEDLKEMKKQSKRTNTITFDKKYIKDHPFLFKSEKSIEDIFFFIEKISKNDYRIQSSIKLDSLPEKLRFKVRKAHAEKHGIKFPKTLRAYHKMLKETEFQLE